MKARTVYEFVRGRDPKESLGLGRVGIIRKFFRDLGISDDKYEITDEQIIYKGYLDVSDTNILELPENLVVYNTLDISFTNIRKLPKGLVVKGNLFLSSTNITELPSDLNLSSISRIYVDDSQKKLIDFIESDYDLLRKLTVFH